MASLFNFGQNGLGAATAAAGTAITRTVPPHRNAITQITLLSYLDAGTVHGIYVMRPIGSTTLSAAAASGATVLTLVADPGPSGNGIAANDYVTIRCDGDQICTAKVSAWTSASKTLTIDTTLPAAAAAGSSVWDHGIKSDTDPNTGAAHPVFTSTASTLTNLPAVTVSGLISSLKDDHPLVVLSDNVTTAGTFKTLTYQYSRVG